MSGLQPAGRGFESLSAHTVVEITTFRLLRSPFSCPIAQGPKGPYSNPLDELKSRRRMCIAGTSSRARFPGNGAAAGVVRMVEVPSRLGSLSGSAQHSAPNSSKHSTVTSAIYCQRQNPFGGVDAARVEPDRHVHVSGDSTTDQLDRPIQGATARCDQGARHRSQGVVVKRN